MNREKYKKIRLIIIICVFLLAFELFYIGYRSFNSGQKPVYFVGINSLEVNNDSYVTVGSNNDNDNHYEKAVVSLYNSKKEKEYEKLYNVGYNSAFFDVLIDEDSLVAVGSFEKTKEEHNNSTRRALIVKYDSEGNVIFEHDFSVLDNSKFTSIIKSGDSYYVTGQSIYSNTKVGDDSGGAILAKYDKDGNLVWSKTFGNSKESIFNDAIIVGKYLYVVGMSENHSGVIVKYDMDGNYISSGNYNTCDVLGFSGIVYLNDSIYVCGSKKLSGNDTNALIVEYDYDCDYVGEKSFETTGKGRFNKMVVDDHNNIIVIGTISGEANRKNISFTDGVIAKYNANLKLIDNVIYGDERDDYFTDVKINDGNYLVVGYSSYEDGSYMSKFISYSSALKVLGVE